jgi:hypothetical protein
MSAFRPLDGLRAVRDARGLGTVERLLLMLLILHQDSDGVSWPSQGLLAAEAEASEPRVRRALRRLASASPPLITVVLGRQHVSSRYRVHLDAIRALRGNTVSPLEQSQRGHNVSPGEHADPTNRTSRPNESNIQTEHGVRGSAHDLPKRTAHLPAARAAAPLLPGFPPDPKASRRPTRSQASQRGRQPHGEAHRQIVDYYTRCFRKLKGCEPDLEGKNLAAASRLAKKVGPRRPIADIIRAISNAFQDDDFCDRYGDLSDIDYRLSRWLGAREDEDPQDLYVPAPTVAYAIARVTPPPEAPAGPPASPESHTKLFAECDDALSSHIVGESGSRSVAQFLGAEVVAS